MGSRVAPRIRPDGASWVVTADDREFNIAVLAEPHSGSVDGVAGDTPRAVHAGVPKPTEWCSHAAVAADRLRGDDTAHPLSSAAPARAPAGPNTR